MSQGWARREGVRTGRGLAHARGPWAWIQGLVMPLTMERALAGDFISLNLGFPICKMGIKPPAWRVVL